MKTLRDYIKLIEAPELGGKGIMPAPGTKRADPPVGDAGLPVAPQSQQIAPAKPTTVTPAAPKAAPHQYVPGATWNQGVLGIGSTGPEVDKLRQQLGLAPNGGKFDNETRDAVIQRQRELGVTADGAWGPGTARADAAKPKTAPQATAPQATAPQATAPQTTEPGKSISGVDLKAPVEVKINGVTYQMFLHTDGYYYIPGHNTPRDKNGNNIYRPESPMPIDGPKTAPFPQGYGGTSIPDANEPNMRITNPGGTTAGGAVTARPIRPATGAQAQAMQRRQAQNQTPEGMSNSDAQLLEKMLTIAGLR
jgi:hypothetical protein